MKVTFTDQHLQDRPGTSMKLPVSPVVTVVIPTRNRPALVMRAVKSALEQTLVDIEVIVVVDGPDPETVDALTANRDIRLHTISLPVSIGGSGARNVGVQKGCGDFVALLDDDDEWAAGKLAAQLAAARASKDTFPVITSRLIARRPDGDEIWPQRQMHEGEAMSEYLFCRENSFRQGEGFIQTSTLFIPRELMLRVPFESGLPRHQDWDWLIRAAVYPGVRILSVWEALVIYHRRSPQVDQRWPDCRPVDCLGQCEQSGHSKGSGLFLCNPSRGSLRIAQNILLDRLRHNSLSTSVSHRHGPRFDSSLPGLPAAG